MTVRRRLPRWLAAALLSGALSLLPVPAAAQGTATLVADEVFVTAEEVLVAEGNVEVHYDGARLTANRVRYDRGADRLEIDGPILLQGPGGDIVTATAADLDPQLRNGLLRGARLVLDRQLQLAATRIDRVEGRYSQLTRAAATSCQVCAGRAPLWEIRAERVVHDEVERQLWFENAQFLIRGVPVLWLPLIRLPDPTLDRARGVLVPRIRSTDQLGIGLKLPYFIPIGPSRDLTLTPYLSPHTRTLEARWRQAFRSGSLQIDGAVTDDDLRPGEARGYLETEGTFVLPRGYRLAFSTQSVSDPAYLLEYGYSDADRLASTVMVERVRDRDLTRFEATYFETLREGEAQSSLPPVLLSFDREFRERRGPLGGTLTLGASFDAFERPEEGTGDVARDMARLGGFAAWRTEEVLAGGLLASAETRLDLDVFAVGDDARWPDPFLRASPALRLGLRWPLIARGAGGATQVLEPVAALAWSEAYGETPPPEDAALVEFDEANLFALTRLPGEDAVETGWRAAFGLSWTRIGPEGDVARLTFGQILRPDPPDVSTASGLSGRASDLLLAGQIDLPGGFSLHARTLVDEEVSFGKTEGQILWSNPRIDLAASYVWLPADAGEDRNEPISEWSVDADYRIDANWRVALDARYDVAADRTARAGVGVGWENECVTVDLSVSRRYTSSADVDPSTDFGLAVNLNGFSAGAAPAAVGRCRR